MLKILPVSALKDNYIWLIINSDSKQTIIIDPSDAVPVFKALKQYSLKPVAMLITHEHWDHINGIAAIKKELNIPIYSPAPINSLPISTVHDNEILNLFPNYPIKVFLLPGHTRSHVAYLIKNHLFCGDIIFPGACGKVCDKMYRDMFFSLRKVSKMPDDILLYPAHEYTIDTLRFAMKIDPINDDLKKRFETAVEKTKHKKPTLPVLLLEERKTNPFLRCNEPAIRKKVETLTHQSLNNPLAVFTALREWKNSNG